MELKIGKNTYNITMLTGDFPIRFYKETGMDIFGIEDNDKSFIEQYELFLNLAYALVSDEKGTLEEFSNEFTPADLVKAYEDIYKCYMKTTSTDVESKTEKK